MKVFAFVLIAYTVGMLLIHLTSRELLLQWEGPRDSWVNRWFSPRVVLRIEALYWLLVLASWSIWPSAAWKTGVLIFASIHLGVWLAGELKALRSGLPSVPPPRTHRFIVAFDLVEAGALLAIAWFTAFRILNARPPFPWF